MTLPRITASTSLAGISERARASRIAMAPRLVALRPERLPSRRPMGVRAPAMITELVTVAPKSEGSRLNVLGSWLRSGTRRASFGSTHKRTFALELFAGDRTTVDGVGPVDNAQADRKSTRLNSS